MPWCKSSRRDLWRLAVAAVLSGTLATSPQVGAQTTRLQELQVRRTQDGLLLYADMQLALSTAVRNALHNGIPVYFVASATLLRERWYWTNETLATAERYWRVSYHPLTRRWRLNSSSQPISSAQLGTGLSSRTFETLEQILDAIGHIAGWQVADAQQLLHQGRQVLEFVFQLDASRLPAALRVGARRDADWQLSFSQRIDLGQQ